MRKIFFITAVIILLAATALVVFVATFDINRYNKIIAARIGSAVGNPVEIGRLSLVWKGRVLLGIEKFQIFEEVKGQRVSVLSFERADAALEFLPLLRRAISVSSISMERPVISVSRARDGKIEVRGYNTKPAGAAEAVITPGEAASAMASDISIDSIVIRDGTVRFIDLSGGAPMDIVINKLDADIKDVSLTKPVKFNVKAAFFSKEQNVSVAGTAGGFVTSPMFVRDLSVDMDLGTIDLAALSKGIPAVRNAGLKEGPQGRVSAKVAELELTGNKITGLSASLDLMNGKLALTQLKSPVEDINMSASAEDNTVTVKSFSARLAGATLKGSGDAKDIYGTPKTTVHAAAEIPEVKKFISSSAGIEQIIDGKTGLSFDGNMSGTTWDAIFNTLAGSGTFTLDEGVLVDTNLLKQCLGALSMFPGLLDTINGYLPASLKETLGKQYTLLKSIRQSFTVRDGMVDLPGLKVETDFADINGEVGLTLQGDLAGSGTIRFSKELSSAMMKAVPEMSYLADQDNIITFPVTFKGSRIGFFILPDVQYIAKKTVMKKGKEIMNDLLKKASEPKQDAGAGGETQPTSQFDNIMDKIRAMADEAKRSSQGTNQ